MSCVFLLSPAYCGGRRATFLLRDGSQLALAKRLVAGTLTLGEAFAFMSGLYFRGKLAYARHFGQVCPAGASMNPEEQRRRGIDGVYVITPTRGLQAPENMVTGDLLREFAKVDVNSNDQRYRGPLDRDITWLARRLPTQARVVLLGSIATGKYVDALSVVLGPRLYYPSAFVGRGDMSRGGLLLRCVSSGEELEYAPLVADASRHGARPPKLPPIMRAQR